MKEYIIPIPKPINELQFVIYDKMPERYTELIRCKDCKEYGEWGDSMICMRLGSYYVNTKPNDFCSRAEVREE